MYKKNPKISIITSVLNDERGIEKTLKSVINQKYKNLEYIVVDGGSTDKTLKIIRKYKKYITKIVSKKDNGIYYGFNRGLSLATGDIIECVFANKVRDPRSRLETISQFHPFIRFISEKHKINNEYFYPLIAAQARANDKILSGTYTFCVSKWTFLGIKPVSYTHLTLPTTPYV